MKPQTSTPRGWLTENRALMASVAIALLWAISHRTVAAAEASTPQPQVRATGAQQSVPDNTKLAAEPLPMFDPAQRLRPVRERPASHGQGTGPSTAKSAPAKHCCDFRVYDAHTRLYDDQDHDGYYTYLQLDFDVDTDYEVADIYADVWLIDGWGDETLIFATEVFTIYGHSGIDDYVIEAELVSGFDPDLYDVLIEVFDAHDDALVARYGAHDSSALSLLPMESVHHDHYRREVHAHGSGGPMGLGYLVAGGLLGWWRLRRGSHPGAR